MNQKAHLFNVFPIDCEKIVEPYKRQNGFLNFKHLSIKILFFENGGFEIITSHFLDGVYL